MTFHYEFDIYIVKLHVLDIKTAI